MAGEVSIELVEQDYIDANRAWMLLYLRRPRILGRYALLLASVAVFLAALEWTGGGGLRGVIRLAAFAVAGGGTGLLLCHGLGYLLLPRRARRIFRQTASLGKPYHYRWSEQGIDYRSEGDNGHRAWVDFYRWCDSTKVLLLMLNEQLFYIIPRRALTAAQAEDLRATVAAHGPPRF
jgi:hypothetical protein